MFLFIKQALQTLQLTASYNGDIALWGEDGKLYFLFIFLTGPSLMTIKAHYVIAQ